MYCLPTNISRCRDNIKHNSTEIEELRECSFKAAEEHSREIDALKTSHAHEVSGLSRSYRNHFDEHLTAVGKVRRYCYFEKQRNIVHYETIFCKAKQSQIAMLEGKLAKQKSDMLSMGREFRLHALSYSPR